MDTGGGSNLNNIAVIGLILLGLAVAGGYWFLKKRDLAARQEQVASKQLEAQKLEQIIKDVENYRKRKESLQQRINLINQLKQNQKGPVRVMDRISQDLPDLVWLDRLNMGGGAIAIAGRGLNPNAIANFVENIKNDPMFEEPELNNLSQVSVQPLVYAFDMTFHFAYAPKPEAAGATTGTAGATTTGTTAAGTSGTAGTAAKR